MKIKKIKTETLTKGILENYIKNYCYEIKFYGKLNNQLFIISNMPGIAYPVVNKKCTIFIKYCAFLHFLDIFCTIIVHFICLNFFNSINSPIVQAL